MGMYWAAQVVGALGFGDINAHNDTDAIVSIIAIFFCLICRTYVQCRIIAVLIQYDSHAHEKSWRIRHQRAILKKIDKVDKSLVTKVTQQEELKLTPQHLLESEKKFFPRCMYDKMLFQSYQGLFQLMGFTELFSDGVLRFLASNLRVQIIPRNEIALTTKTFVRSIFILKEGALKVVHDLNPRKSKWGLPRQSHANDPIITQSSKLQLTALTGYHEHVKEGHFQAGTCFGISGRQDAEMWSGNIIAVQSCMLVYLSSECVRELTRSRNKELIRLLDHLFLKVKETKVKVKEREGEYQYASNTRYAKSSNKLTQLFLRAVPWKRRTIYHPCEAKVNVFLITTSTMRLLFICYILVVSCRNSKEMEKTTFVTMTLAMCLSMTLLVLVEGVVKLHMGYWDIKTKTIVVNADRVMKNYFSLHRNFLLDVVSVIPTWYFSIAFYEEMDDWATEFAGGLITSLLAWIVSGLPYLLTGAIFYYRALCYFKLPPQLQVGLNLVYHTFSNFCDSHPGRFLKIRRQT